MSWLEQSERLHRRVRALPGRTSLPDDEFDALALDIARFQAEHSPGYRRVAEAQQCRFDRADTLAAVPAEAFRLTRVAVHPPELDRAVFETSGTTSSASGRHHFRTTATYRALAVELGRRALLDAQLPYVVTALAPEPSEPPKSSLAFMMRAFMEEFDGCGLDAERSHGSFRWNETGRWLVKADHIDVAGLKRAAAVAQEHGQPLLLLATSFALVALIDHLGASAIELPARSVVMQTGGFKGRSREVDGEELRRAVSRSLAVPIERVIAEYGMTELSSQLYEGTLNRARGAAAGVYLEPPWLRVQPVDPITLQVTDGVGLARFIDLANIDSAVCLVTQDLVQRTERGIVLLGRATGAPARGCSLALESLLLARREP